MKRLIFTMFAIGTLSVHAQKLQSECLEKIRVVDSLVGAENFSDAISPWKNVRQNCPSLSNNTYVAGEAILRFQIEMASPEAKEEAVRELLNMYDEQNKYFPQNTSLTDFKKAMALSKINGGTTDEIYQLFDKAFHSDPKIFTDPVGLYTYFDLYFKKYSAGDKSISPTSLFARQDEIEKRLATLPKEVGNNRRAIKNVTRGMDGLLNGIATQENLVSYYESSFDAKKTDTIWLANASKRLLDKNYMSNPIFLKISEAAHRTKPTMETAYSLGSAALRNGLRDEAAKYYSQSAQLSTTAHEKATLYYTIASTVYGSSDKKKAKEFAQLAIKTEPGMGKAYMFLAQLYANGSSECGLPTFEQKAIYWLAADMARKAGDVDPNFKKTGSEKTAAMYKSKAPSSDEIKKAKMRGKTIDFKCWINESFEVPKS